MEALVEEKKADGMPDYTTLYHNESRVLAHKLIDLISTHKEDFIPDSLEKDADKIKVQSEANADFGIEFIKILSQSSIPADYATLCIDKMAESLAGLSSFVKGTLSTHENEILSRTYGKKNYKGKFTSELVTVGEMLLKVDSVREETGGKKEDFYDDVK